MEKTLIITLILSIIILIVSLFSIIYLYNKNKLSLIYSKILLSEESINENLKNKNELVIRAINIIERKLKIESKKFEEVKKIKSDKINPIIVDSVLLEATDEIMEIKNDYKELSKIKSFDGIINDITDSNILLSGSKRFYNKYASTYNNLVNSFIIKLFFKNYKAKSLFPENSKDDDLKLDITV